LTRTLHRCLVASAAGVRALSKPEPANLMLTPGRWTADVCFLGLLTVITTGYRELYELSPARQVLLLGVEQFSGWLEAPGRGSDDGSGPALQRGAPSPEPRIQPMLARVHDSSAACGIRRGAGARANYERAAPPLPVGGRKPESRPLHPPQAGAGRRIRHPSSETAP